MQRCFWNVDKGALMQFLRKFWSYSKQEQDQIVPHAASAMNCKPSEFGSRTSRGFVGGSRPFDSVGKLPASYSSASRLRSWVRRASGTTSLSSGFPSGSIACRSSWALDVNASNVVPKELCGSPLWLAIVCQHVVRRVAS